MKDMDFFLLILRKTCRSNHLLVLLVRKPDADTFENLNSKEFCSVVDPSNFGLTRNPEFKDHFKVD